SFDAGKLHQERRLSTSMPDQVLAWWEDADKTNLFPGRRAIIISESELSTPTAFDARLASLQTNRIPIVWDPVIDVRLVSMPTQPGYVRIALRIINQTPEVKDKFLDYVDPNLYAVKVKVNLPKKLHRMTTFQELPASFRYKREMHAVGINAHVD